MVRLPVLMSARRAIMMACYRPTPARRFTIKRPVLVRFLSTLRSHSMSILRTRLLMIAPVMLGAMVMLGALVICAPVEAGVIANGDFNTRGTPPMPFADWMTFVGSPPADGGGFAQFRAGDAVGEFVQLAQFFNLHPRTTSLSFEYQLTQEIGNVGGGNFSDSFTAALFDPAGNPINPIDPLFLPGFFGVEPTGSNGFREFTPTSGVTTSGLPNGWRQVSLSLAPLRPGRYAIGFQIRSDQDARLTTVNVDNVVVQQMVNPIPEPASMMIWAAVAVMGAAHRRRSLRQ